MKNLLIGLSVGFNILVIVLASLVFTGTLNRWIMPRIMGPGYDRWVSQFDMYTERQGGIVFLGDSITEGAAWEELFPATLTRNRGISGDTALGVLNRLDQVIALKPEKIFLLIGTNDLGLGISEDVIAGRIEQIAKKLQSALPQTSLYIQSVLPRASEYQQRVENLNEQIARRTADHAQFIDLYPRFLADSGNIDTRYSNDQLHLLGTGYEVWRDAIAEKVVQNP